MSDQDCYNCFASIDVALNEPYYIWKPLAVTKRADCFITYWSAVARHMQYIIIYGTEVVKAE